MRLIDADVLMELYADAPDFKLDMFKVPIPVIRQNILDMPTIDPASLRPKGEWEMVDEYCCHAKEFRCSACGGSAYYDHYTRCCDYDFCPNCGADMRGDT